MEPLTAGAIAALTLVLSKALEKTGETLGERVMQQASQSMQLLKSKFPDTAGAIELAAKHPELVVEQPENYGVAVLVDKLEEQAKADPEIRVAVAALATEVEEAAKLDSEVSAAFDALTETLKAQRQNTKTITNPENQAPKALQA